MKSEKLYVQNLVKKMQLNEIGGGGRESLKKVFMQVSTHISGRSDILGELHIGCKKLLVLLFILYLFAFVKYFQLV